MVETSEPFLPLHVICPLFKQIRCHPCVVAAYSAISPTLDLQMLSYEADGVPRYGMER